MDRYSYTGLIPDDPLLYRFTHIGLSNLASSLSV